MKRVLCALAALTLALTASLAGIEPVRAAAYSNPAPANDLNDSLFVKNRLALTDEGYMRVAYNGTKVYAEYYDKQLNFLRGKTVDMELPKWGGFYAGFDAYYLVEGQNNEEEKNDAEVIRVIKYDKDWNRIGAASITCDTGCRVRYPFDLGGCEMTEYCGMLYFATGHEGFVDPSVGQGHQGLLLIGVDEDTMMPTVVDEDFWHSFVQFVEMDGSDLYMLQQSEGSRCTQLSRYDRDDLIGETDWYYGSGVEKVPVLEYGGKHTSAWAIACYATVEGLAMSSDNALCLGASIDQSRYDDDDVGPYNIYLTVTPKLDLTKDATELKWLTNNTEDQYYYGMKLTKINDDRFMISWKQNEPESGYVYDDDDDYDEQMRKQEEAHKKFLEDVAENGYDMLEGNKMHYMFVDGSGNKVSEEFVADAAFSDCRPIVDGNDIIYCASSDSAVDFYIIDSQTGELTKKVYNCISEDIVWTIDGDGTMYIEGTGDMPLIADDSWGDWNKWGIAMDNVTKLVIGDGITSISDNMFNYFSRLKEVRIGSGVKTIGKRVLYGANQDLKIYIPKTVENIGEELCLSGWSWDDEPVSYATVCTPAGSVADEYAREHNMTVENISDEVPVPITGKMYRGDINADGEINVTDISKAAAHVKGIKALDEDESSRADVNSDDSVNVKDISLLAAHVKGVRLLPEEQLPEGLDICIGDDSVTDDETTDTETTDSETEAKLDMALGEEKVLNAKVSPEGAVGSIEWTSSDSRVVTVDENGVVKAVGAGTATITAKTGNGVTAECSVTVMRPDAESVKISGLDSTLTIADRGRAIAVIAPEAADGTVVKWTSSDESVVRVNETGAYEAVGLGSAVITVTAPSGASDSVEVTVTAANARSIVLDNTIVNCITGDTFELSAEVFPDIAESELSWESSDETVATVQNGKVTCVGSGLAIITAVAKSGISASCRVNVDRKEPMYIYSNTNYFYVEIGDTEGVEIQYELYPAGCDDQSVTFEVEDESIVTVENGRLIPHKVGETYLTMTTVSGISYDWYIMVIEPQPMDD